MATTAVLNGIDGAQKTGGRNKARSVAAALAEQDQERMRSMPVVAAVPYISTPYSRTVKVKGVNYTVVSSAAWATDPGGGDHGLLEHRQDADQPRIVSHGVLAAHARQRWTSSGLVTPPAGSRVLDAVRAGSSSRSWTATRPRSRA